uniref:Transposase n=1 Tax=Anisakis simplex TaxID=6269 RepID=A0A0M3JN49_ANISI
LNDLKRRLDAELKAKDDLNKSNERTQNISKLKKAEEKIDFEMTEIEEIFRKWSPSPTCTKPISMAIQFNGIQGIWTKLGN